MRASNSGITVKVVILPLLVSLSVKTVADHHGHAAYQNKH